MQHRQPRERSFERNKNLDANTKKGNPIGLPVAQAGSRRSLRLSLLSHSGPFAVARNRSPLQILAFAPREAGWRAPHPRTRPTTPSCLAACSPKFAIRGASSGSLSRWDSGADALIVTYTDKSLPPRFQRLGALRGGLGKRGVETEVGTVKKRRQFGKAERKSFGGSRTHGDVTELAARPGNLSVQVQMRIGNG